MSDTYTVSGEIIEIYDVQVISDTFKKREFILKHAPNPEYPDFLKLEVVQNKTDLLDKYKVGDSVEVDINLKGKKWEKGEKSGYFNSLQAWRIQPASSADNEPW
jgi:hypothetical protein|tara:strand:- start:244 stop:555 length:312 start_codon:yes stop_codon:yes gene_type:complete